MNRKQHSVSDYHLPETIRLLKVVLSIIILSFGGLIYVIFRSNHLLMFNWFHNLGLDNVVTELRNGYGQTNIWNWVRYNLPAGLWLLSYLFIIDSIWNSYNNFSYKFFILIMPIAAIISETMQFFHIMPGTFDVMDMISYVFALFLFQTIKILNK